MFHKILVAIDGSPQSSAALEVAIDMAQHAPATLTLLHAFPHVSDLLGTPYYEHLAAARTMIGDQLLNAARVQVGDRMPVDTQLLEGPAAEAIVRTAEAEGHDLIVVGSHGQGRLRGMPLGSVSSAVTQRAPCPVLVVRGMDRVAEESEEAATAALS